MNSTPHKMLLHVLVCVHFGIPLGNRCYARLELGNRGRLLELSSEIAEDILRLLRFLRFLTLAIGGSRGHY